MHCNLGSFEFLFIFFGMRVSLIGFRYNLGVIVESKSTLITMQNSTLLVASFLFGWKFQNSTFLASLLLSWDVAFNVFGTLRKNTNADRRNYALFA